MSHTTLTATYRITTPMFCSGADQQKAELRLPSFKGALRFWWRALHGHLGVEELRGQEAELFGSSEQNVGQSKVRMRWMGQPPSDYGTQKRWPRNAWQHYTGYGLLDEENDHAQRGFLKPNQSFAAQLTWRNSKTAEHPIDANGEPVTSALVALGLFGGLGGRSRKGWGSVTLESLILGKDHIWSAPSNLKQLREEIDQRLHAEQSPAHDPSPYTTVSPSSQCAIGPVQMSWEGAQAWISQRYKEYIKGLSQKTHREAFGLPRKDIGKNSCERRASPVLLHVLQLGDKQYAPMALLLPSQFLENQDLPSGDWQAATGFMDQIDRETRGASS